MTLALTRRQTLLWLDSQLFPTVPINNIIVRADLRGRLSPSQLAAAWSQTVSDRDVLRTFVDRNEPTQSEIAPCTTLPIVDIELGEKSDGWIAQHSVTTPTSSEPWEAALLRFSDDHHLLFLRLDQLLCDDRSVALLLANLTSRHEAREPIHAPTFREYAAVEIDYRNSQAAAADDTFWHNRLAGSPPEFRLYGRPCRDHSYRSETTWATLSEASSRALRGLAHDHFRSVSPAVSRLGVLTTALAVFLYRASGQYEYLIGIPHANRTAQFAQTCGPLAEQVFVRVRIVEGETFHDLGMRIHRELVEGLQHGRACLPTRDLPHTSLTFLPPWPTQLAGVPAAIDVSRAVAIPGVDIVGTADGRPAFGMRAFDFENCPLRMAFDHHANTFSSAARGQTATQFLRILEVMARNSSTKIDEFDLLTKDEQEQLLALGRGPEPEGRAPDLLDQLKAQTQAKPDSVAVVAPEGELSYRELSLLTDALAGRLSSLGVTRESRVGVALPRGSRELVTFLATLKAGGCYVPIDPDHPPDRVRVILADAAPELVVSTSDCPLREAFAASSRLLIIDELRSIVPEPAQHSAADDNKGDQLAYVLFTSGSTGRPKGVEVTRGALSNLLRSMQREPGLSANDRILAITTTTFDIAGLELYLPLWVGGTVVIAERETVLDPSLLRARLDLDGITTLQATPATWRLLLDAGFKPRSDLRMFSGGEPLTSELAARLLVGGGELWNLYGPTETTVWSSVERVLPNAGITIGRPIDHTQIYILNSHGRLSPPGVIGEIVIGGYGVARGYRGRPELTRERFIPDRFGTDDNRLYRTGDLGRLLDDGRFECLGRLDYQVKVRGYRIELGEIETVLRSVPGVKDALVLAISEPNTEVTLCAYWTGPATRDALYDATRSKLPVYMVPTVYVPIDTFPLNTNGKIDRKALPKPVPHSLPLPPGTLPRNDVEERIAAIWSEVLDITVPAVDRDFFSLGGSSLTAVRVRARMEEVFGTRIPLRAFFQDTTIERLASQLGRGPSDDPIVVALRKGSRHLPPLHCLLGIALYRDLALSLDGDRTVVGIHVPFHTRAKKNARLSVPEIARRYVEAIRSYQPIGPYCLIGFCFGGIVAYEAARQMEASGEHVALVVVLDAILPRGRRTSRVRYLKHFAKHFRAAPGKLRRVGMGVLHRLQARFVRLGSAPPLSTNGNDELGVDDLETSADVRLYQGDMGRLTRAALLVCRSDGTGWPPWLDVADDLGWSAYADRFSTHTLTASHRAMLDKPKVLDLARVVDRALACAEEGPVAAPPLVFHRNATVHNQP